MSRSRGTNRTRAELIAQTFDQQAIFVFLGVTLL
jgi:hypothetical protein